MKCALIDDEKEYFDIFYNQAKQFDIISDITFFNDVEDLLIRINHFELVFVDINMPKIDGILLARKIYEISPKSIIIFITNNNSFIYDAFGINVLDFIPKNELANRLPLIISKLSDYSLILTPITFHDKYNNVNIIPKNIICASKFNKHIEIRLNNQKTLIIKYTTFKDFCDKLNKQQFVIIDCNLIVNLNYIKTIDKNKIELINNLGDLFISRPRKKEVIAAYNKYITS